MKIIKHNNTMAQIHLETGMYFHNRKDAKKYFGKSKYKQLLKDKILYTINTVAHNELFSNSEVNTDLQSGKE